MISIVKCLMCCVAACAFFLPWSKAQPFGAAPAQDERPRARDIGIEIGTLPTGEYNAITDVPGVTVGHKTIIEGDRFRTGVTAILPHGGNMFREKVPAAVVVGNGFGKLVGTTQVGELGVIETPILLTNTLSTFATADALVAYMLSLEGNENVGSVNPVVGETNDGGLNDIRAQRVRREDVFEAIKAAKPGPVLEGCVGAGTGTRCLGFKGGIGTASRKLPESRGGYTVGVITQTNFGGSLTIAGAPVGRELRGRGRGRGGEDEIIEAGGDEGSCMMVVATDAPLDARQLKRLATRALLGMGATGSVMSNGSGDYVIAFSTAESMRFGSGQRGRTRQQTVLSDGAISPLFQAVKEATEEAIINSLLKATTTTGYRGRTSRAVPIDKVVEICKKYGVIKG